MFQVPGSSSPAPSTPDRSARFASRNVFAATSPSNPSSTPAAAPPTSLTNQSTTPLGPPPSSVFASTLHKSPAFSRSSPLRGHNAAYHPDNDDTMDQDHDMFSFRDSINGDPVQQQQHPNESNGSNIAALARAMSAPLSPTLDADLVLSTETILQRLWSFEQRQHGNGVARQTAISQTTKDLLYSWRAELDKNFQTQGIGPGKAAPPASKALFLASLLLSMHHPFRQSQDSGSASPSMDPPPFPEVLLDWLRNYHDQFPEDLADVMGSELGPAAHERFWDVVYSLTLRGGLKDVSQMLKAADFSYAATALEDGSSEPGYTGRQLANVQKVVNRAISVLDSCPAIQANNWNVKGLEWATFRKRASQALSDLETFAEGPARESYSLSNHTQPLHAENFGVSGLSTFDFSVTKMSQRAQSQVPWAVYECLRQFYGQLLGRRAEIVSAAADWVEATIGLAAWWDGEEDVAPNKSLASTHRRSLSRSKHTRPVDLRPGYAYQEKLAQSLEQVVTENDDPELQVNAMEPIEVGLACIFQGNFDGVLGIIKGWSSTIATAVVEIANYGSWLAPSQQLMNNFDEADLMLLSYGKQAEAHQDPSYDRTLIDYAELLSRQERFHSRTKSMDVEGWELAVQVLTRLEDETLGEKRIEAVLDRLNLTDGESVEKIITLCDRFNLPGQGRATAEKYATYLASETADFGGALFYYARANQTTRVKQVLNVLISSCLVQSRAFPPGLELDRKLKALIDSPEQSLARLGETDASAARILSANLSGYAMLRKFYDLRDETGSSNKNLRGLARKRQAASALISVILSASDSIHGGLYDASVESVVQVDGLLVLLGEALAFLNQPRRVLDAQQIFALLKAIEDIETVPSGLVFDQCEECLKSAIASANGEEMSPPQALLRKSIGAGATASSSPSSSKLLTASSSFELVNSGLTNVTTRSMSRGGNSLEASGVLVEQQGRPAEQGKSNIRRGWDWRRGLTASMKGHDVLQILRLGLARELSRTWTDGES